jgi:UDP-N-acetylmuramate: L-alanyl-gamma-D-glutamyl-meso-diaminopimelate ligase
VANGDDPMVRELVNIRFAPVETFGFGNDTKWLIEYGKTMDNGLEFHIARNHKKYGTFFVPLIGDHNILNTAAAIIVLDHLGLDLDQIQNGLNSFKNVKRRLEIRGEVNGITVYDDFAHHPTAIRETLNGLHKQFPNNRIWAVFEPRTNTTRRNIFQQEMVTSFAQAFGIAIGKINRPHLLKKEERFDRDQLCNALKKQNKVAFYHDNIEEIINWLVPQVQGGDKIVIMSNGGFDDIYTKMLQRLETLNR